MAATEADSIGHGFAFAAWMLVGATFGFGVVSILTVGAPIVAVGVLAALLLLRWHAPRRSLAGIVSGVAAPFAYLCFINRDGPGLVCTGGGSQALRCVDEPSPWGFGLVAVLLFCGGVIAYFVAKSRSRS